MAYIAKHIPGHSSVDHFGAEIVRRLAGKTFRTRRDCERAIKRAAAEHAATHSYRGIGPRIDAVRE